MLFTKGDRQELMENSLEQKNRNRETSKQSVFFFSSLPTIFRRQSYIFASAVKSKVPYKMKEI